MTDRNHKCAIKWNMKAGNNKWYNVEQVELNQINKSNTFIVKGKDFKIFDDHTKIQVYFVCVVQYEWRYKGIFVAGGDFTSKPDDSIYSDVVMLKNIHLITFWGRLIKLPIYSTDVDNFTNSSVQSIWISQTWFSDMSHTKSYKVIQR